MLNKKLVLAALLGAALADDTVTDDTVTDDTVTDDTNPVEPVEPVVEDKEEEEDDRLPTRDWKEVMPDGSTTTVLCDQGESALWSDAKEKLVELAAAKVATAEAYVTAESDWSAANQKQITATQELATFNSEAVVYETALTDANGVVTTLQGLEQAAIAMSVVDANAALLLKTDLTDTAQGKVNLQLARVEGLLTAQRTQELEEATWEERRMASADLNEALANTLTEKEGDVTMYAQQLTKRSYLFQMSGIGIWPTNTSNTRYATGCAFGWSKAQDSATNFDCYILEQADASLSVSTWDWSTCYSGNLPREPLAGGSTACEHKGLDSDSDHTSASGLIADATTRLGSQGSPGVGDLYKAFQDVNPHYHATDPKLTPHNAAITAYLAWQKKEILAQYLTVAAWNGQTGTSNAAVSGDYMTGLGWGSAQTDGSSTNWQPWINAGQIDESTNKYWYASVAAAAVSARTSFDGWNGSTYPNNGVALTPAEFQAAANALVNVWHGNWILAALNAEKTHIGATTADGKQATAAADVVTATNAKTDNEANTDAMVRWKALAAAEVTAIEGDVERARTLLVALTAEVSEVTRDEFAARADVATAVAAEAAKADAATKLGNNAQAAGGVTGAYAVQAAANDAANSIIEQRKYHVGRLAFYDAILEPLFEKERKALTAKDDAEAAYDAGLALLDGLRDQCKKQAFTFAQERLQKSKDAAALKADKITEVETAYADTAKFPAVPAVGALCNYPKGNEDPAAKRPDCGEDNCCGAAQRFLADGTKLSIETCQKPETTVYTYWPALPENALVAPTSETWRFQCISAAGRLAASVAAALAAGYLSA